ncbi:MAG: hypothetical protein MHM6MM_002898 [Cercozoa sp. M6MM]
MWTSLIRSAALLCCACFFSYVYLLRERADVRTVARSTTSLLESILLPRGSVASHDLLESLLSNSSSSGWFSLFTQRALTTWSILPLSGDTSAWLFAFLLVGVCSYVTRKYTETVRKGLYLLPPALLMIPPCISLVQPAVPIEMQSLSTTQVASRVVSALQLVSLLEALHFLLHGKLGQLRLRTLLHAAIHWAALTMRTCATLLLCLCMRHAVSDACSVILQGLGTSNAIVGVLLLCLQCTAVSLTEQYL